MKATFVSVWDGDIEIRTPAKYNLKTREVNTTDVDVRGLDNLDEEYLELENGQTIRQCPECGELSQHFVMVSGIGHTYNVFEACSNPDCISNNW